MNKNLRRLFFGIEVHAPWPERLPVGRILNEAHRHMTLVFLGNISYSDLNGILAEFPLPLFQIGLAGFFDACLLLPQRHPHVVAWHGELYNKNVLYAFQEKLLFWLLVHYDQIDQREWMPHVTLCRKPFDPHAWKKAFVKLPFYASSIHLYESQRNLIYHPLWSHAIKAPFSEIEHTADLAFAVRGESILQLYHNAFTALAFKFPPLLEFFKADVVLDNIEDLISALNAVVALADGRTGCPFKAVSHHGDICEVNLTFEWEMIVDV